MSGTSAEVLLIEPDNTARAAYTDALGGSGLDVVSVPDCSAARQALDTMTPRLIIARFDVTTHDECLTFVQRLRNEPRTRNIPMLLAAEIITGEDLRRATEMNVLGVSVGPDDGAKMTAVVNGVLNVGEGKRSA